MGIEVKTLVELSSTKTPPSVTELTKWVDEQIAIYKTNPEKIENVIELRNKAYATDLINDAHIELTLAEKDIYEVEKIADASHKLYEKNQLSEDEIFFRTKKLAGYLSLLIHIHKGGEWVEFDDSEAIKIGHGYYMFLDKTYRRIINGYEDNLLHFYQSIEY